ncbi:hypothetical protein [Polymorphospora rubra]|uniref:Gram-positive cocci surface proteins LPxTG domain-containing protein n=1 Tax=Polymorphospora rubra TaxID=338584 RepID=A0A810NGF1_9ACTN|nr:hypothetical protein [Polymorphospora rubra]BCJ70305.1 hypothetical protein Prubr_73260 [Polymorphospora rubra]
MTVRRLVGLLLTAGLTGIVVAAPALPAAATPARPVPPPGTVAVANAPVPEPSAGPPTRRVDIHVSIAPSPASTTPPPTPTGTPDPTGTPGPTGTPSEPTKPGGGGDLPRTGLAIGGFLALGAACVGAGVGLRALTRRRR